jgi:hypothetical protein
MTLCGLHDFFDSFDLSLVSGCPCDLNRDKILPFEQIGPGILANLD